MGKQGPCYHCGITTTPLWRNGPPDKPVLCNACGSRWRTKGTLENYMPMHAGGFGGGSDASLESRWPRAKKGFATPSERHPNKRKNPYSGYPDLESAVSYTDPAFSKNFDEEFSNRSSLGSTISSSEASIRRGNINGGEFAGHRFWDKPVPSKKRTTMARSRASSEKMTRSFMAIEEPEVSSLSCPYNDPLIVHNSSPLVAVEIGLGGVLLRQPLSVTQEPESEASSFLVEKKGHDLVNGIRQSSPGGLVSVANTSKSFSEQGKEKGKNNLKRSETGRLQSDKNFVFNNALLENFPYKQHSVLQSSQSPLVFLEMKDIVNFDTFVGLLSSQEQAQLMKLLAPVDTTSRTESLKQLLDSSQFEAALTNFQQLLCEGVFDSSDPRWSLPLLQHFEKLFVLMDLGSTGWMDQYLQLQRAIKCQASHEKRPELRTYSKYHNSSIAAVSPFTRPSELQSFPGRPPGQFPKRSAIKGTLVPNEMHDYPVKNDPNRMPSGDRVGCEGELHVSTYHCSNSEDMSPQARHSGGFSSTVTGDEQDSNSDLDLLVNIPSGRAFQEAELLQYPSSRKYSYTLLEDDGEVGEVENGSLIISNTWHMDSASAWDGLIWKNACAGSEMLLPNRSSLNP